MNIHRASVWLAAACLLPGGLAAQPLVVSDPFVVSWPFVPYGPGEERSLFDPAVIALSDGDFAVAWTVIDQLDTYQFGLQRGEGIEYRRVDASGQPGPGMQFHSFNSDPYGFHVNCKAIAAAPAGSFVLAYSVARDLGADLWAEGPGGGGFVSYGSDTVSNACPAVAVAASGTYFLAWSEVFFKGEGSTTYLAQWFSAAGQPLGEPRQLGSPSAFSIWVPPAVGIDAAGEAVVVWPAASASGLLGQRFDPQGTPVGEPFQVTDDYASIPNDDATWRLALAMAPDGGFAVAWVGTALEGEELPLMLRRFTAAGVPVGASVEAGRLAGRGELSISADHQGNFALVSQGTLRLFNRSLVLQGAPVAIGKSPVALADSGRLLTAWSEPSADSGVDEMQGQLWQARHEADLCLYRGSRFLCDTAGAGAITEAIQLGRGMPRFQPLLGDIDGDGRADPCVHRGNLFLCDTTHRGGAPDVTLAFGWADDLPLLGDVDGDGRADPCVYRHGVFRCDTAHDGGSAEVKLDLRPALGGDTSGVPLLGDVEGIGRADACLYRGGTLICGRFTPDGRLLSVLTRVIAGQPGDVPLLGDLDAF
jgi:hypothetical protein